MQEKVSIRPGVGILGILKHIEYKHWYAIAEFVDNAIDSYLKNEKKIKELEGKDFQLEVSIEIDPNEKFIRIRDNAGGIDNANYSRAFRPAERPPDNTGLSEFGMGMKSAACWYSDYWTVCTTALNESVERTVIFDMERIFEDKLEELEVIQEPTSPNIHYTIIELKKVHRIPQKNSLGKIKNHLTSIYRDFIRRGILQLKFNKDILCYEDPKILVCPPTNDPNAQAKEWIHLIDFPFDDTLSVHGFVAIRAEGKTKETGLALFRRGRVIEGSFDEPYQPDLLFGGANSFRRQRVFGELHLEGFEVTFTKKGFLEDDNMKLFLDTLRSDIKYLLIQADTYRVKNTESDYKDTIGVLKSTVIDLEKTAQEVLPIIRNLPNLNETPNKPLSSIEKSLHQSFEVDFNDSRWEICIEMSYDPAIKNFYEVGEYLIPKSFQNDLKDVRQVGIRLSLIHPFMLHFTGVDKSRIEPILKIVAALGLAEAIAKSTKSTQQGEIRRNTNELVSKLMNQQIAI